MKNVLFKLAGVVASAAMLITAFNMNSNCICIAHQPQLPANAKKLRKF
jgi:cyclic lactone autoinducer peptide